MRFQDLRPRASRPLRLRLVASPRLAVAGLTAALIVSYPAAVGQYTQQLDPPEHQNGGIPPPNPLANPRPDANGLLEYSMQRMQNQKRIEQLNVVRHKEMTVETSRLLQLANEVKAETRPNKDSLTVIELNKVEAIEKLARSVREKMEFSFSNQ